jgi:hypothetical protein
MNSAFTGSRIHHPEDEGSTFLQNIITPIYYTALKPKRRPSSDNSFSAQKSIPI